MALIVFRSVARVVCGICCSCGYMCVFVGVLSRGLLYILYVRREEGEEGGNRRDNRN